MSEEDPKIGAAWVRVTRHLAARGHGATIDVDYAYHWFTAGYKAALEDMKSDPLIHDPMSDDLIAVLRQLAEKWQSQVDGADRGDWGDGQASGYERAIEDLEAVIDRFAPTPGAGESNE